ncbi:MAG: hypothetical protein ACRDHP_06115, partial [Ktedonobacterales bacterium]
HSMDPVKVLAFALSLGARPGRVLLVGCEPERLAGDEDELELRMGLSEPVRAAVDEAATMIDALVVHLLAAAAGETHEPAPFLA